MLPSPQRASSCTEEGFTLIEVMCAAFVLVLAITTSLTTLQRSFASIDSARNMTLAGQIMQTELEKVRLKDWSTVSAYTDVSNLSLDSAYTSNTYVSRLIANRGLTLARTVTTPETDLLQITFTVSWRTYDGRPMSRSFTTYYARYGMYDYFYNSSS